MAWLRCNAMHIPVCVCMPSLHFSVCADVLSDDDHSHLYYKLERHSTKWREIGKALGFKEQELDAIEFNNQLRLSASKRCLSELLSQWLQWAPGDGRGSKEVATKKTLCNALFKINLGRLAQEFE